MPHVVGSVGFVEDVVLEIVDEAGTPKIVVTFKTVTIGQPALYARVLTHRVTTEDASAEGGAVRELASILLFATPDPEYKAPPACVRARARALCAHATDAHMRLPLPPPPPIRWSHPLNNETTRTVEATRAEGAGAATPS